MSTCYRQMNGGRITDFQGVHACGNSTSDAGFTSCCFAGSTCLENNLCYASTAAAGSAGFYEALCTDPQFKDPSCGKRCTSYTKGDVIFDTSLGEWRCCGADSNGNPNCGNPTNVTFEAPSPRALLSEASATASSSASSSSATSLSPTTTASRTISTAISSSTSAPVSASSLSDSSGSGTSAGAIAGIAVGAVVVVGVVVGLLYWFLFAKKRRHRREQPREPMLNQYYDQDKNGTQIPGQVPKYIHEKSNSVKYKTNPAPPYYAEMPVSDNTVGHPKPDVNSQVYELGN